MALDRNIVALVPAGDRGAGDPVARAAGVSCKVLAPIAGTPMIVRVLNALQATGRVHSVVLIGPDQAAVAGCPPLQEYISREDITHVPAGDTLSDSIQSGLAEVEADALVLVVTADHALIDGEILNYFLDRVIAARADVSVGLVDHALVRRACPGARRTVLKFSEGGYCGCNLYAMNGPRAREIISLWQRTQAYRKRPWRMALGLFGFGALIRYLSGRLNMEQTRRAVMKNTGISIDFIELPYAHAGIDVDTPEDLDLAEKILEQRQ